MFVRRHYLFREANSFLWSRKAVSKDKYPNIFSHQMEAIAFTIIIVVLQIFFAMHMVLKIGEYSWIFPSFSWGIFACVTCSDQLCMSENIWWIIKLSIPEMQKVYTPPTEGYFSLNPHPLWKFHFCAILSFKNWALETSLPLGISINLSGGGHGYFLKLHHLVPFLTDTHSGVSVFKAR